MPQKSLDARLASVPRLVTVSVPFPSVFDTMTLVRVAAVTVGYGAANQDGPILAHARGAIHGQPDARLNYRGAVHLESAALQRSFGVNKDHACDICSRRSPGR